MSDFSVRVGESQANDIALVCAMGPAKIRQIVSRLEDAQVTIHKDKVSNMLGWDLTKEDAVAITNLVFGLSSLSNRSIEKIPEIVHGVSKTIASLYSDEDRFRNWSDCVQSLISLLQTQSVFLAAKATDISYDFERVLTSSRILTSIRPVFDVDRTRIVGSTIVQTLRLEYISAEGGSSNLSIALDAKDMIALREACDDGLAKAQIAKKTAETEWSIEAIVPGEDPI